MSQIHLILSFIELAILAVFGVCIFHNYNKSWNFRARVLMAILIVAINIAQLVIEIRLEKNFAISVMMLFMWGMNLWIYYLQIRRRNFRWK